MLSTALAYNLVSRDLTKSLARTAADPVIKREIAAYERAIGKVKSIDDFLENASRSASSSPCRSSSSTSWWRRS